MITSGVALPYNNTTASVLRSGTRIGRFSDSLRDRLRGSSCLRVEAHAIVDCGCWRFPATARGLVGRRFVLLGVKEDVGSLGVHVQMTGGQGCSHDMVAVVVDVPCLNLTRYMHEEGSGLE